MSTSTDVLEQLLVENAKLRNEVAQLKASVSFLNERINWFTRQIFGKRSEKSVEPKGPEEYLPGFDKLFSNLTEQKERRVAAYTRRVSSHRGQDAITLPSNVPVERRVIDLSEKEKVCPETGKPLVKIGEEVTQKLAHKPGSYYVKEIVRVKYALPPESSGGIRTPPLPESLLDRCQADESFLAHLLTLKYADHLPLYRISEMLAREGIHISRQLLCNWVLRSGQALKPLYEEMKRRILKTG